jgi:hypothetical protein
VILEHPYVIALVREFGEHTHTRTEPPRSPGRPSKTRARDQGVFGRAAFCDAQASGASATASSGAGSQAKANPKGGGQYDDVCTKFIATSSKLRPKGIVVFRILWTAGPMSERVRPASALQDASGATSYLRQFLHGFRFIDFVNC